MSHCRRKNISVKKLFFSIVEDREVNHLGDQRKSTFGRFLRGNQKGFAKSPVAGAHPPNFR